MITRHARSTLVYLFDLLAAVAAWVGGFLLRFNFEWPAHYAEKLLIAGAVLVGVHAIACRVAGLYRGMWVFASLPDLMRVMKAVGLSALAPDILPPAWRGRPSERSARKGGAGMARNGCPPPMRVRSLVAASPGRHRSTRCPVEVRGACQK